MKGNTLSRSVSRTVRRGRGAHWNNRELIDRTIADDAGARQEFDTRFRRFLYRLLQENNVTPDDQEDMISEIFLHLMERDCRRLRQWKGTEQFLSWLRRVVRNLVADERRRRTAHRCVSYEAAELLPTDYDAAIHIRQIHAAQQAEALWLTLARMSEKEEDLVTRGCYWGQSYQEIANALGMTVAHVGVALHRAKMRLRRNLSHDLPQLFAE